MFLFILVISIGGFFYYRRKKEKIKKNLEFANELRRLTSQKGVPSDFFNSLVSEKMHDIQSETLIYRSLNPNVSHVEALALTIINRYKSYKSSEKLHLVIEILSWYKKNTIGIYDEYYNQPNLRSYLSNNPKVLDRIYNMEVFDVGSLFHFESPDLKTIMDLPSFLKELPNLRNIILGSAVRSELYSVSLGVLDLDLLMLCKNLERADLQFCDIKSIKFNGFAIFSKLKELRLGGNQIAQLPDSICNIKSLEILTLWDNPLKELPLKLGELVNLKGLDISFTEIKYLPKSIINIRLERFEYSQDEDIAITRQEQLWLESLNLC